MKKLCILLFLAFSLPLISSAATLFRKDGDKNGSFRDVLPEIPPPTIVEKPVIPRPVVTDPSFIVEVLPSNDGRSYVIQIESHERVVYSVTLINLNTGYSVSTTHPYDDGTWGHIYKTGEYMLNIVTNLGVYSETFSVFFYFSGSIQEAPGLGRF